MQRRFVLALLCGLLAWACEDPDGGEGNDGAGPADAIEASSDAGLDVPPADVPPADVPPADVPPADVPPVDVPPADVPPTDVSDEHCPPPASPPAACEQVDSFECGFQATCADGVVHADWHVHHFCSQNDPLEDIVPYTCDVTCPFGCTEGTSFDWPQSGAELVAMYCHQCADALDCDAQDLPHDDCVGEWTCSANQCSWQCGSSCVAEGGSVPVVPNAPECCPGLGNVPCDAPDADGVCQSCDGASLCVACGNGQCGPGENPCNCPADCTNGPVDLCALAGGTCAAQCADGDTVVANAGCPVDDACCVKPAGCLGLGAGFLDFDTEGKCCEGLVASSDCDVMEDGSCSCKKCPCYLCLPCGDGVCGPFEHACNCPADCAPAAAKVPSVQSDCLGSGAGAGPVGADGAGVVTFTVEGSTLKLDHQDLTQNCCAVLEVWATVDPAAHAIRLEEKPAEPFAPCFCECVFALTAEVADLPSGTWTVTLYNELLGYDLVVTEVTVP